MKFKRQMTNMEVFRRFPNLPKMQQEIEALGAQCVATVFIDVEIPAESITPHEGRCSECHTPVVMVEWSDNTAEPAMAYAGAACPKCKTILEYAGFNTGPFDLASFLGAKGDGK